MNKYLTFIKVSPVLIVCYASTFVYAKTPGSSASGDEWFRPLIELFEKIQSDGNVHAATIIVLIALLTLFVYYWQKIFGVPEWLAESQKEATNDSPDAQEELPSAEPVPVKESKEGLSKDFVVDLAYAVWRLSNRVQQLDPNTDLDPDIDPKKHSRLMRSVKKFNEILNSLNIMARDPIHSIYMDGTTEFKVIDWIEVPRDQCPEGVGENPFVYQTIRPSVRINGKVLNRGEIIVAEYEGNE